MSIHAMQRLFFAVRPPDDVLDDVASLQWGLDPDRWIDFDQLHITLRFLGEVHERVARTLHEGLGPLPLPPLPLQLKGVGHFPSKGRPRVLWVGLRDDTPAHRLRAALDRQLAGLGLPPDGHRLHPHLTVARLGVAGKRDGQVAEWLGARGLYRSRPFQVPSVVLYRSILRPEGAIYERVLTLRLAGEQADPVGEGPQRG